MPGERVLSPDTPLDQLLRRTPIMSGELAVVVADNQVLGVLSMSDIARAVEIGALQGDRSAPGPTH